MSTSKDYKNAKNYIHNELGINQEFIKDFVEKYLEKAVDKMVSDKIESKWMENLIIRKIGQVITENKKYSSNEGIDYIKTVIKETVKEEVVKRIKFDSIEVS